MHIFGINNTPSTDSQKTASATRVARFDFKFTVLVLCLACSVNPAKCKFPSESAVPRHPLRRDTGIPKVASNPWKDSSGLVGGPSSLGIRTPKQRSGKAGACFGAQVVAARLTSRCLGRGECWMESSWQCCSYRAWNSLCHARVHPSCHQNYHSTTTPYCCCCCGCGAAMGRLLCCSISRQ